MTVSARIAAFGRHAHDTRVHAGALVLFAVANAVGYRYAGGRDFLTAWGGSFAAVLATAFLVWKSQGYWFWMMVNAGLWLTLFFDMGLPILAWLQVSFLAFSIYGMTQWALVRRRIGYDPRATTDVVGSVIALVVFAYSVYAYWNMPGYTGTVWWALEAGTVVCAIAAMWMDAFRYKANWFAWTFSNVLAWPLFFHSELWGPFAIAFVYQALNVVGYFEWRRDERRAWLGREVRGAAAPEPTG